MRLPAQPSRSHPNRSEQVILFRVAGLLFGVSSASVQEVRSVDSLAGASTEINQPSLRKVRHLLQRGDKSLYVVSGAAHFGLPPASAGLVFVFRKTRAALLVDGMERMATMTRLQALPLAFCNEERQWYRGLTSLDQTVVPVVDPEGFLNSEELALLDASIQAKQSESENPGEASELSQ
ncbi:MAG TPA: chemotaxis protein CheW [Candidatus Acidoferrum sp.]|nr:chemotaxis protein CheW [Candidatus Acidoferrum sp.]